jgi:Ca2+-binding RTX toxin-like protein
MRIPRTLAYVLSNTLIAAVLVGPAALPAAAATLTVDQANAACNAAGPVYCTVQDAINGASAGDTINISAGTYAGQVTIDRNLTLRGSGKSATTLVQGGTTVVTVQAGVTASIFDLKITGGINATQGGGIHNEGTLNLSDVEVSQNFSLDNGGGIWTSGTLRMRRVDVLSNGADTALAPNGAGGGLYVAAGANATIVDSRFEDNGARAGGGISNHGTTTIRGTTIHDNYTPLAFTGLGPAGAGITNQLTGDLFIENSTISANQSDGFGGGLVNVGDTVIANSTFSGNVAFTLDAPPSFGGGAIFNSQLGSITLNNVTISDNQSTLAGAGIYNEGTAFGTGGSITMRNSIVADQASGSDCAGFAITSAGYNLDSDNTCSLTAATDQPSAAVGLQPLANNGGGTETHALTAGSPAVNNIPLADCRADTDGDGMTDTNVTKDQRGRTRNLPCDSGSYELIAELCNGLPATIVAGPTDVIISGTAGNDVILGNDLDNRINAGDGDDVVCAGRGNDRVKAGSGNDRVFGGMGNDIIKGQAGNDSLDGGAGRDKLFDGDGDDVTRGGRGKDKHIDGPGTDEHDGGPGADLLNLKRNSAGALVDLAATDTFTIGGGLIERATTIEWAIGTRFDDTLIGDNLNNRLSGLAGVDSLVGGDGNDRLNGGADDDTLDGGNGTDILNGGAGTGDYCEDGETVSNCELP